MLNGGWLQVRSFLHPFHEFELLDASQTFHASILQNVSEFFYSKLGNINLVAMRDDYADQREKRAQTRHRHGKQYCTRNTIQLGGGKVSRACRLGPRGVKRQLKGFTKNSPSINLQ